MKENRTIFIGDVHGCYDELKSLLKKLELQKNDSVYFVGDIINKGPKSFKVLNFLYKNKKQFKCILGNHELNFLNYLEKDINKKSKPELIKYFKNLKRKIEKKSKLELIEYLKNLPLYIETKDFLLIHGGLIQGKSLKDHSKEEITNIRAINGDLWYNQYLGNKKVIYGHNALDGLQIRENTIGLDSGCVYGKSLTAYILETGEIYSQSSYKTYINAKYEDKNIFELIKNIFK